MRSYGDYAPAAVDILHYIFIQQLIAPVADDDISFAELLARLGGSLGHTAREDHNAVGVQLLESAHRLPRFSVALGGDGAGIDDVDIRLLRAVNDGDSVPLKALSHRLRFILIDLAAQGIKCRFHISLRSAIEIRYAHYIRKMCDNQCRRAHIFS